MSTSTLTAEERQQRLNDASDQYMRGEITDEEFEDAKRQYTPDLRPAMRALAENLHASEKSQRQTTASPEAEILLFLLAIVLVLLALLHRVSREEPPRKAA
jgi:hypothetical protein